MWYSSAMTWVLGVALSVACTFFAARNQAECGVAVDRPVALAQADQRRGPAIVLREGDHIVGWDWRAGREQDVEVEHIRPQFGGGMTVELYDWNTHQFRDLDLE